jgi:hypothetical protein
MGGSLYARYAHFKIEGVADGVLSKTVMGMMESPYIVVASVAQME